MAYIRALVVSAYKEINSLISQPKHYVVGTQKNRRNETVLLSTKNYTLTLMCKKTLRFYATNCVYLDYDLFSIQIRYTSAHKSNWLNSKHYR